MKKIRPLLCASLALNCLATSTMTWAEEAGTAVPSTNDSDSLYASPQPQKSRLEALTSSLSIRRLDHQIQTLNADDTPFLALYKASETSSTQGCVILLHGDNQHPDWPDAIAPLRNALPQYSWCTFSIEVPDIIKRGQAINTTATADKEEGGEDTDNAQTPTEFELPDQAAIFARIQATIEQANAQDMTQLILLGYRTGASYALTFTAQNPDATRALALIDIDVPKQQNTDPVSEYELAQRIRRVNQPVLDYYVMRSGSEQFATWRQQAANQRVADNATYLQLDALPVPLSGEENKATLIQTVRGFLKQQTTQINQRNTLPSVEKGLFY
ncbi:alpha/beta hydrolase family protein [Marinomonas sp. A79]|uniref:Alpha/beta hydrolase family protein n=1 Tax=Marinomonas vulgaris TaxID=2823372 RepID=A0ABS5H707_9GAMM|nr:DUF3530 family protein [Marinomonas vulgaris]MBR7887491.1 alpha/beta hydrolase family protein [Marinomonas vulgaris]